MSYAAVYTGLQARLRSVGGLRVLDGEPTALAQLPAVYSLADEAEFTTQGAVRVRRYRTLHRVCVRYQEGYAAEAELIAIIDAVYAAFDADPRLGGAITSGYASIREYATGFMTLANTRLRIVDITSEVVDKS
jgi:hypothetical protein